MAEGNGVVLGYLKYVLGFDSLAFEEGADDAEKRLKAAQRSLQKTADKFAGVGTALSVGITAPFTALVASSIPAAKESAEALGQVKSALASMGDAAGRTLPQLQDQAATLMHLSTFDDDDILRKVTANLLTFGNVSGQVFDRAQLAAVNLSARLGQDLQSSALQLGKALNDPVKGMTALSRVGVSFTAQQQAQVKAMVAAGDTAGAQGIILGELEKQYGGAAAALREATPGIESQQAWADFQEVVGGIALKVLPALSKMLAGVLTWFNDLSPGMQTFIVGATAVAAALGPIALGASAVISVFATLLPVLAPLTAGLLGLSVAEGTAATASYALGVAINAAIWPLTAIAAAIAGAYLAWKHWDKIKPIIDKALAWVKGLVDGVKRWLVDAMYRHIKWVVDKLAWVGDAFFKLYDRVVGHSYIPDMVDGIGHHMARLEDNMVRVAQDATAATAAAFAKMDQDVQTIMDRLFPERARAAHFLVEQQQINAKVADPELRAEAQRRLAEQYSETLPRDIATSAMAGINAAGQAAARTADKASAAWKDIAATTEGIRTNFADSAETISGTLQSIVGVFRGKGSWLDKLLGAVELGARAYSQITGQFGGFRAAGGPVMGGTSYLVGERGPELFTPSRSGYVTPNKGMQGRAGGTFIFDARGAVLTEDILRQANAVAARTSGEVYAGHARRGALRVRQQF